MSAGKDDAWKDRWSLLINPALLPALRCLLGAMKYGARCGRSDHDWLALPDGKRRFRDALLRHVIADSAGQYTDEDSRCPHLAHAAMNCLFILALEMLWGTADPPTHPPTHPPPPDPPEPDPTEIP